jgi:hypothetical protein
MAIANLTRQDLVSFLPNLRAVVAFENLFTAGNDAGIALAAANAAQLSADAAQTTANAAQLSADAAQTTADTALFFSELLILAPPVL